MADDNFVGTITGLAGAGVMLYAGKKVIDIATHTKSKTHSHKDRILKNILR